MARGFCNCHQNLAISSAGLVDVQKQSWVRKYCPMLKRDFNTAVNSLNMKVFVNEQSIEELFSSAEGLYRIFKMLNFDFFTSLLALFSG